MIFTIDITVEYMAYTYNPQTMYYEHDIASSACQHPLLADTLLNTMPFTGETLHRYKITHFNSFTLCAVLP